MLWSESAKVVKTSHKIVIAPSATARASQSRDKRCSKEVIIDLTCVTVLIGWFLDFALKPSPRPISEAMTSRACLDIGLPAPLKVIVANLCLNYIGRPLDALYHLPSHSFFDLAEALCNAK